MSENRQLTEETPDDIASGCCYTIDDLLRVIAQLRDPDDGCPWDIKQTFRTIAPHILEECYELVDTIERGDSLHMTEELGDVLFQVVFYSQMGREQGVFDFELIVDTLVRKLIRRHPHIFVDNDTEEHSAGAISVDEVKANWESIKQEERKTKARIGVLADVPITLPSLSRAQKLQERAASSIGFDWPELSAVIDNLEDEIRELREALTEGSFDGVVDEFGDVLFSAVNVGRHLKLDVESSLRCANSKFERRFNVMECAALEEGIALADEPLEKLEMRWLRAKILD